MVQGSSDEYGGKVVKHASVFSVVPGIFKQSDPAFPDEGYDLFPDAFGLFDTTSERWQNLARKLEQLNSETDEHTTIKLVLLARHGEGYHNVAIQKHGYDAWDTKWAKLNGDGQIVWGPDPVLTVKGEAEARAVNQALKAELTAGAPLPQALYCSPFQRAAGTLKITWDDILLDKGMVPHFKEGLRERLSDHTCDMRSTKTQVSQNYPGWTFDDSFTQEDILFDGHFEEDEKFVPRVMKTFKEIIANDPSTVISITAHSGPISAILQGIGHRDLSLLPGGVLPVLLRITNRPLV